ncbi:MAG: hypothetical protein AAFX99_15495 [Myxococcota bacterium]
MTLSTADLRDTVAQAIFMDRQLDGPEQARWLDRIEASAERTTAALEACLVAPIDEERLMMGPPPGLMECACGHRPGHKVVAPVGCTLPSNLLRSVCFWVGLSYVMYRYVSRQHIGVGLQHVDWRACPNPW